MTKQQIIDMWKIRYDVIRDRLAEMGGQANSMEYNLLAMEALRLHECILDLVEMDDGSA